MLRTALRFSSAPEPTRCVMVTSAQALDGKTTTACNLALALAIDGARVLLIDADMRRSGVHRLLNIPNGPGLSHVLTGQASLADVLVALDTPGIWAMTAGPSPPNPSELLGSAQMRTLIEDAKGGQFDWVIIDSPPVLPVTDAVLLSPLVAGVVFVVRSEMTRRPQAARALEMLTASGARLLGAVLNRVDLKRNRYYYSPVLRLQEPQLLLRIARCLTRGRTSFVVWLLDGMIVWSLFAVGGVYVWAGAPLIVAATVLAIVGRSKPGTSHQARALDFLLLATLVAAAAQLVPLPLWLRGAIAPHADGLRQALYLGPADPAGWWPLSVSPGWTAYTLGLVITALVVFWTVRDACAPGMPLRIVRHVAFAGLVAALVALADQAGGDPALIYGRWQPLDPGARPFGPFVNRNHFATWVLMACPLAAGYVAAALSAREASPTLRAKLLAAFEWLGTGAMWVSVAVMVMTLALVVSTSRSGLVAFTVSLAGGAWLASGRLTRKARGLSLLAAIVLVAHRRGIRRCPAAAQSCGRNTRGGCRRTSAGLAGNVSADW